MGRLVVTQPQQTGPKIDALSAITADLDNLKVHRRRHFTPALVMSAVAVAVLLFTLGSRPDLWTQPWWQVAIQIASWAVCLIAFPAIGVGLWFPSRPARVGLALLGIALAIVAALGWPAMPSQGAVGGPCGLVLTGTGLLLLGIGALSGAFAQRRASSAVYWVATGIALAGLNLVTWACPNTANDHVMATHLLPAVGLVLGASVFGAWLRRRYRR
jgi:hypothetical protein